MGKIKHLRWWIAGLLAAATALNYLDRQSLPVVIGEIQKEITISDRQFGQLQSLFLLAYGIMYAVGGRIVDWLGTRAGYVVMIVWWSAANFLQGTVSSVIGLGIFRFLLGMGEGGGFPASAKAVSEWFPVKERSLAFGIFNTGSSVGAVVAPPLIAFIVGESNWRWVFFITGALGFVWAIAWLKFYDLPSKHPSITADERELIEKSVVPNNTEPTPWLSLLSYRQVWGLLAAKFLSDSAWYFFIFWLPKYLGDVRHLNIKTIGYFAWIPYAFAGVGSLTGGWLSSFLIRRGFSLDAARKIALAVSASLMPVSLLIVSSPLSLAIVFFSLAMLAHQFWSTIMQTLPADLFPPRSVASVAGLAGCAGAFGGVLFSLIIGDILTRYGYGPVFLIAGVLHPLSLLIVFVTIRRVDRISE